MDKTIEIKAIDKEKALERALKVLGISLTDNEEVEIIEKISPKKKLFGLLGTESGLYEICIKSKIKNEEKKAEKVEKKNVNTAENFSKENIKKEEKLEIKKDVKEKNIKDEKEIEIIEKTKILLEKMSLNFEIEIKKLKEKSYVVNLIGEDNAIIIGQKGKTLNSFEYLLNSLVKDCRIEVDVEKFKEKRNETLRALAKKMAEKVLKTNKTVRLNAMPPRERKIIHEVVNKYPNLDTYSEGRDPKRYIVIKKKK
ncbi:MAG: R3H domain-containing nucleic acid-binding protein [Fusobacterium gastrosuis]|uniref:Jag family protein n=1 Tax=Fusobacterium gastrosuis TaxID=1755100 RepID=UPI002A9682C0|nr:KH domain-containing protein [Fusobacteriaceae bacterium]MDY5795270.1 R3H domain-containing nucleic acid-binding protein [Fusobacterium gastrosuis]